MDWQVCWKCAGGRRIHVVQDERAALRLAENHDGVEAVRHCDTVGQRREHEDAGLQHRAHAAQQRREVGLAGHGAGRS